MDKGLEIAFCRLDCAINRTLELLGNEPLSEPAKAALRELHAAQQTAGDAYLRAKHSAASD